jgi:4-amino-4-deoxy-L-arabinose transferase-like glycosyltransferase
MLSGNPRPTHRQFAILAAILILASVLRFHGIGRNSLSVDELGSMETAAGRGQLHLTLPRDVALSPPPVVTSLMGAAPIGNVPGLMGADVHPPLYFIALRIWQDVFGGGDVASRALSATAGAVGVLLLFDVGRWLAGVSVGLWASLLMALAQPEIVYSQDARPYALAAVFTLAAADALVRITGLGPNRRRLLALGAGLTAACLTNYFVLPAVIAMGIYAMLTLRGPARQQTILVFAAACAAVLILWGHGLWVQHRNFTNPWMYWFKDDIPDHIAQTWRRAAVLPLRYLAEPPAGTGALAYGAAALYLLPFLRCRKSTEFLLPGLWLIGCAGLGVLLDLRRGTNQLVWIKYTLLAGPAVYLMLPMLLGGWMRHAVGAAAAAACLLALPETYASDKADLRTVVVAMERQAKPDQPVFIAGAGWGDWYTGGLYMALERYATRLPRTVILLTRPASAELLKTINRGGRCWMLMSWTGQPPETFLPGWNARKISSAPGTAMAYELTPSGKVR